jgi:lysophospholipid acyltransferase (LPLAT)-like uncharacterized protein
MKSLLRKLPFHFIIKWILKGIIKTTRMRVIGIDELLNTAKKGPTLIVLWHNRLPIIAEVLEKHTQEMEFSAFISQSRDGEILARLVNSYTRGHTIRVPHSKREQALKEMIDVLKENKSTVIITPDGPRGPSYRVKPGTILAAKQAQASIIPLTWSASRFWELKTWDKMMIPKPFSRIEVRLGKPIELSDGTSKDWDNDCLIVEQALSELTHEVEQILKPRDHLNTKTLRH